MNLYDFICGVVDSNVLQYEVLSIWLGISQAAYIQIQLVKKVAT